MDSYGKSYFEKLTDIIIGAGKPHSHSPGAETKERRWPETQKQNLCLHPSSKNCGAAMLVPKDREWLHQLWQGVHALAILSFK